MKVLTFFTVRGGSGKTVLSAAFASYVSYILGKRAMVLDFDGPEYNLYNMRLRELSLTSEGDAECNRDELYIVEKVENTDSDSLDRFAASIRRIKEQFDYIILDFPGSFSKDDAICQLATTGVIDMVIIPVELDAISICSAKTLSQIFGETGLKTLPFFNRVHGKEDPALYDRLREWFERHGVRVSEATVKNSIAMKKEMGTKGFIRSTVCFPEKEIRAKNPGIINLFEEIVRYEERGVQTTEDS